MMTKVTKNMSNKEKWLLYCTAMLGHIKEKGKVYDKQDMLAQVSNEFIADSMWKYIVEIRGKVMTKEPFDISTLHSIAHYASELYIRSKNEKV